MVHLVAPCFLSFALVGLSFPLASAQDDGYFGYSLEQRGDPNSVIYETLDTRAAGGADPNTPPPDVFLNASVSVDNITIDVQNITAKINLSAQVLALLDFNAGVDVSIDRVRLEIDDVKAKVLLEARLSNVVAMIGDVLDSLDLNPVLATLGQDINKVVGSVTGSGSGSSGSTTTTTTTPASSATPNLHKRDDAFVLEQNILFSINDYSGNTHTNRILTQTGAVVDESLDNNGHVTGRTTVGTFATLFTPLAGHEGGVKTTKNGIPVTEKLFMYIPLPGVEAISAIFFDDANRVVAAEVIAEANGGGSSTISEDD
ncbi:hypothetical protein MIND_01203100 [Mycena indigotica]|uniref:Uncharacterized protein n=1 Tax=Mycena indigotica TaxID=2126181 RepID=A0A8H6S749_9AGAR|nr:uncharacterized protein MIND_01203100 [Mycena indigotica]KAF7293037.1 hypothetical protein MIND_01203100 [Mycena indigotica]